jgi:hypothetical protein
MSATGEVAAILSGGDLRYDAASISVLEAHVRKQVADNQHDLEGFCGWGADLQPLTNGPPQRTCVS